MIIVSFQIQASTQKCIFKSEEENVQSQNADINTVALKANLQFLFKTTEPIKLVNCNGFVLVYKT